MKHKTNAGGIHKNPLGPLVLPVYIPALIYAIGTGAITPVLVLAALDIGFNEAESSAVVGVFGLIGVIASPPLGRFISRIGDRAALISAGIVTCLALLLSVGALVVGTTLFARSSFVIALVLIALGANIWQLGRQAYVAENIDPAWRARGLSTLGGMNRLGQLIGPAVSTALLGLWFLGSPFWFAFVLSAIATLMIVVFLVPAEPPTVVAQNLGKKPSPQPMRGEQAAVEKTVRSVFATVIMGVGLNAISILRSNRNVIVPLWGTYLGVDERIITATFAVSALVDSVMFVVSGGLMDKHGRLAALIPSLTVMPAGIIIMLAWPTVPGFVIGACVLGFGNGFGAGVVMTTGADLSPVHNRANFLGLWQAIVSIGTAAGPFIASGMTHAIGVAASLWATAGIGIGGAIWVALLIKPAYRRLGIDLRGRPLNPQGQDPNLANE